MGFTSFLHLSVGNDMLTRHQNLITRVTLRPKLSTIPDTSPILHNRLLQTVIFNTR